MKNKNERNSVSYTKNTEKENMAIYKGCKHKWKKIYANMKFCVKCGFMRWW